MISLEDRRSHPPGDRACPLESEGPISPDSVTNHYNFSFLSKSTVYVSFPTLWCGANSSSVSDFWDPVGISEVVFTQHSKDFLVFVVRMSPFLHHPLILNAQYSDKGILMLESVIRGGWLTISDNGSGSHVTMSGSVILGVTVLVIRTSERFPTHVSCSRLASFSVREGTCPVELSSSSCLWMKLEIVGWRKRVRHT